MSLMCPTCQPTPCRTVADPTAVAFLARFSKLSRDTHLAYLNATNPGLHGSLQLITPDQWAGLQQYVGELAAGFGQQTFAMLRMAQPAVIEYTRGAIAVRRVVDVLWIQGLS